MSRNDDRGVESRRIIGRVGAETEASMARREPDGEADWAELWGKRVGRFLGVVLLIYLVWWLVRFAASGG